MSISFHVMRTTAAERFALPTSGRAWTLFGSTKNSKPRVREMLEADWASELQANIAQPKRVSAGHPQRQLHAVLGGEFLLHVDC